MGRFDGRVALITGAARGIGAASARQLAGEGAAVVITDMDAGPAEEVAQDVRSSGGKALAVACDVSSREQVFAAVDRGVAEFGRLDIMVSNAGITRDNMLYKMTDDDWDAVINTHLRGSFLAAQAAQKPMVGQRYGKIILMSSLSALGMRGQTNYSTAKAGLQGMARTLAIELGQFNINVNAIAPGYIETRMTRDTAARMGLTWEQLAEQWVKLVPLRRIGTPEDIAKVVAFLASDEAGFITGETIYVSGGAK
ncbi:MAG: glucose 1-dehydrogenase [Dehalococcoidia bacterium]|nr:glucose 1-dehydrogenase [Dehalococcoidia bacterium]